MFQLNRRVFKAYLLKESLEQLWDYRYEGAMLNYLRKWIDQLRWQRLPSFQKLAETLLKHIDGILNYCRTKVRFGVVEAVNGNIRMLINRGRGYKNMRYLLLKVKRMAATNTEYVAFQKMRKAACHFLRILAQSRLLFDPARKHALDESREERCWPAAARSDILSRALVQTPAKLAIINRCQRSYQLRSSSAVGTLTGRSSCCACVGI